MVQCEAINPSKHLGMRPFCRCCGGGNVRDKSGKFRHVKAVSRAKNAKARKPKYKDHRQ